MPALVKQSKDPVNVFELYMIGDIGLSLTQRPRNLENALGPVHIEQFGDKRQADIKWEDSGKIGVGSCFADAVGKAQGDCGGK